MEVVTTTGMPVASARPAVREGERGSQWWMRTAFLFVLLFVIWRVFSLSHLMEVMGLLEGICTAAFFAWMLYRLGERWYLNDWRLNSVEVYCIALVFVPVWSALAAHVVFGQPIIYGIVAFKDFYLFLGALHIYRSLRQGFITLRQLEFALVLLAWLALGYFYFATLFTDPSQWIDTPLAGANDLKGGGVYYRFNMTIVFFGAIYYTARAFVGRQWWALLPAMLFAGYVIFLRMDRTSMAVMLAGMLGAAVVHVPPVRVARVALLSALPALLAIVLLFQLAPDLVDRYERMFADAFGTVLGTGNEGGEVSVRVHESQIAERYIERRPLTGNGRVSPQWSEGGYERFMGYFFPSDLGFLGLVFIYGWPVTFFLYLQFVLAAAYVLRVRGHRNNVFFITSKFLLLALSLDSLTNGMLTQYAGQVMLLVCIVHHFSRSRDEAQAGVQRRWIQ